MEFAVVLENRLKKTKEILMKKEKEYAKGGDRYHNFRRAAMKDGITPEKALQNFMRKHEVSVDDLVDACETDPSKITRELIDEKIGDNINYLILLEGLLINRVESQKK